MPYARGRPTMTSESVSDENWARRDYNQPGPKGQDLGSGQEADRSHFTGAGHWVRAKEPQPDREAGG